MNRTLRRCGGAALLAGLAAAPALAAQQATAPLAVGVQAPDFSLPAATADGPQGTVKLSDFRGKTVVLAFFFKARTKG
jgi:thioredoxin-dependent peroxiredoxin